MLSQRGNKLLVYNGTRFIRNNSHNDKVYWKCTRWHSGCKARIITSLKDPYGGVAPKNLHNHPVDDVSAYKEDTVVY